MAYFRYNRFLLFFIVIGLLASLLVVWQRHKVEVANSTVELVMDYEDISELARLEGVDRSQLMQQFRTAGITTLAVYDVTLEKLQKSGAAAVISGSELLRQHRTGTLTDLQWQSWLVAGQISPDEVYITGMRGTAYDELRADLARRFGARVRELAGSAQPVVAVKGSYDKLIK